MVTPISLIIDVKPFCEPPFCSKPFLFTILTYCTLSILGIIVGPARRANIFELYLFPESFRVSQLTLLLSAAVGYGVVMRVVKRLVAKRQQHSVTPV